MKYLGMFAIAVVASVATAVVLHKVSPTTAASIYGA